MILQESKSACFLSPEEFTSNVEHDLVREGEMIEEPYEVIAIVVELTTLISKIECLPPRFAFAQNGKVS